MEPYPHPQNGDRTLGKLMAAVAELQRNANAAREVDKRRSWWMAAFGGVLLASLVSFGAWFTRTLILTQERSAATDTRLTDHVQSHADERQRQTAMETAMHGFTIKLSNVETMQARQEKKLDAIADTLSKTRRR